MTDDKPPMPPHGKPPKNAPKDDPMLPCSECGMRAHRATLSMFGARCVACYEAYVKAARPMVRRPA